MRALLLAGIFLLTSCQSEKKLEEIHFGPGPGDTEENIIEEF